MIALGSIAVYLCLAGGGCTCHFGVSLDSSYRSSLSKYSLEEFNSHEARPYLDEPSADQLEIGDRPQSQNPVKVSSRAMGQSAR